MIFLQRQGISLNNIPNRLKRTKQALKSAYFFTRKKSVIVSRSKSFRDVCGTVKKPGFFLGRSVSPAGKNRISHPSVVSVMRQPENFSIC
ncbi:Uncharacterized protein dnm_060370 [Desulfonema magnum]|uniref:Uncharacterized protein n=1 Tax=Desulfonema magnum TaxID=45655 RepID=A0A975BQY6_9BACT|nr:Uncharacterized protein dnm_060370 [Desulfonema magnum]